MFDSQGATREQAMSRGCDLPEYSPMSIVAQSLQGTKRQVVADIAKRPCDETPGLAVLFHASRDNQLGALAAPSFSCRIGL